VLALPKSFTRTITQTFGAAGRRWLAELPALLERCQARWGLVLLPPFELSYNYVAPAVLPGGRPCVLKLGLPRELTREIAALRLYGGEGAVRLLDADPGMGALLLERLLPGRSLHDDWDGDPVNDEEAARAAALVMTGLWRAAPEGHPFLPLADWAEGLRDLRARFGGGSGPLPERLVDRAEGVFAELLGSSPPLLLHGDLHHGNILSARRDAGALASFAIDPKGVVGDAGYEVGAFLRNPAPRVAKHPGLKGLLERRIAVLAETLAMDARDVAAWGLAHAVLSAWWDLEDGNGGWEAATACAAALSDLTP
jgi:streptomycin 6-kinase